MSSKINGPINIVRIEGEINGIKKILYLYFDFHMDVTQQTKCEDYLSDDVTKYIKKELLETSDKDIDFFMEHRMDTPGSNLIKYSKFRDKYIEEMEKFFYQNFRKEKSEFKNVRFHYADIRNSSILFSNRTIDNILFDYSCANYNVNNTTKMINIYTDNKSYLHSINDILSGKEIKLDKKIIDDPIRKLIDISKKYKNTNIKEKIKELIDLFINDTKELIKLLDLNINLIVEHENTCNKYFDENGFRKRTKDTETDTESYYYNDDDKIASIKKNHNLIFQKHMIIHATIMDMYFLRRFCDKKYITHGIFYGGGAHCIRYINYLVKAFDFKITHASYTSEKINKLNDILSEKIYDVDELNKYLYPPLLIQCSDMSDFPKQFS
jgi:hypothetical protein